jgi:protein-S-isoprenylcysteine O-methyltransferase Ste14
MPFTRQKKIGEKAWKQCNAFRILADIFWIVLILTIVLWIWFPIGIIDWKFTGNYIIVLLISIVFFIPAAFILVMSLKAAGKETVETSEQTQMYSGIYKKIRHPQILGTILLFIFLCLIINSLFLLIWLIGLMVIITPIVIYFEEKDLLLRFGDQYSLYKKNTGAIIPKFRIKRIIETFYGKNKK